jgi:hypothetical protein
MVPMANPAPISYDLEATVDEHLVDELVRNGIPRGRRVRMRIEVVPDSPAPRGGGWSSFIGMIDSGESDLAERSEEILGQEFGRR